MTGTTAGGKKAAVSRGHENLSEAGRKGGQKSSGHKAIETRAKHEGKSISHVASEIESKGGEILIMKKNK